MNLKTLATFVALATLLGCSNTPVPAERPAAGQGLSHASHEQSPSPAASPNSSAIPSPQPNALAKPKGAQFKGSISVIDDEVRSRMTYSWHEGCPVGFDQLRILRVDYFGFDGAVHRGELIVHRDQAAKTLAVIEKLFEVHFPIARMELVDVYQGDDNRSVAADNTSAFNCREVDGRPGVWSQHAYGRAVDINPVENPYISSSGEVTPPAGQAFTDRSKKQPGMIHGSDAVVHAFTSIGWSWGGYWSSTKDYQHFSSNGR